MERVCHTFPPVYDSGSRILIVGTMPSVQSRSEGFYYGNPRNRFYEVLATLLGSRMPRTVEEKKEMLHLHHIAVYDVLKSCDIHGSADSSIRNAQPNDFSPIFKKAKIAQVFANGKTAYAYYRKYISRDVLCLPSTSPANASFSLQKLQDHWSVILGHLK
ncbi:DNA-deoxyinosine glycosylase [Christensenellaceae bacterium OttesenSCG-928-K19]|nr:DNA-deoxyinosine glycosylase [Christensenellaceae bacterium OttesenSCG-928-K19]